MHYINKTSISSLNGDVNISIGKSTHLTPKWQQKKLLALEVSDHIKEISNTGYYARRALRMAQCSNEIIYQWCKDCGHVQILQARMCRDKVCPICTWRLALKQYGEMIGVLNHYYNNYADNTASEAYFLTLTVPNCTPKMIDRTMTNMSKQWDKLMHRSYIKKNIIGWARKTEITYNAETNTLHPHYHVILFAKDSPDCMIDYWLSYNEDATRAAQNIQRIDSHIDRQTLVPVDLHEIPDNSIVGAILETFKYTTKSSDILNMPVGTLRLYLNGIDGRRMIAYGGLVKDIRALLLYTDTETETDTETDGLCVHCSSPQVEQIAAAWSFGSNTYQQIDMNRSTLLAETHIRKITTDDNTISYIL